MPVTDFWCALSVALDSQEDREYVESFRAYIAAGGDPKKFPKRKASKGHSGNRQELFDGLLRDFLQAGFVPHTVSIEDVAKVKGWQRYRMLPDGSVTDMDGNPVPRPPGRFVPVN